MTQWPWPAQRRGVPLVALAALSGFAGDGSADGAAPAAPAATKPPAEINRPPKRKHWGRRLGFLLVVFVGLVVVAVVLAPNILSLGPVRGYVLGQVNQRLPIRVEATDWSLSWFGAQEVQGLDVREPDGGRAVHVGRLTLHRGLAGLLADWGRLGPVGVDDAEVWADDLNRALAALAGPAEAPAVPPVPRPPAPPTEGPPTAPPVEPPVEPPPPAPEPAPPPVPPMIPESVEVRGLVVHTGGGDLRVPVATFATGPKGAALQADLAVEQGDQTGTASVKATLAGLVADWQGPDRLGVVATVTANGLPIGPLAAMAGRDHLPVRVEGTVSGTLQVTRGRDGRLAVDAGLRGEGLVAEGEVLRGDRPALAEVALAAKAAYDDGTLTVEAFRLTSPIGTADARGTFALAARSGSRPNQGAASPTGEGSAEVHLALGRVAEMFRHTLGLREDLTVEHGALVAEMHAANDAKQSRLRLAADLKDFRGRRGEEVVALTPLHLEADLERAHAAATDGAVVNRTSESRQPNSPPSPTWFDLARSVHVKTFQVSGAFGRVEASGRLDSLKLDGTLDLAQALAEVERFADLGGYKGRGAAVVHLETTGTLREAVHARLEATLNDLLVRLPDGVELAEPEAKLVAKADLQFDPHRRLVRADVAALDLASTTATVQAKGYVRRMDAAAAAGAAGEALAFHVIADGGGTLANLAGLAAAFLATRRPADETDAPAPDAMPSEAIGAGPAPRATSAGAEPSLRDQVQALVRRMTKPGAQGRWTLDLDAGGTVGQALAVKAQVGVDKVTVPPEAEGGEPFVFLGADIVADGQYLPGDVPRVTVNTLEVSTPYAAGLKVEGPATVTVRGMASSLDRPVKVAASANLPALLAMLRPLGVVPADPSVGGDVRVAVTLTPAQGGATKVGLSATGDKIDLAWPDGGAYTDPLPRVRAAATVARDEAGQVVRVDVAEWSVTTVAGGLSGTAAGTPSADGWRWDVTANGEGAIQPVAHTVARLRGAEPTRLTGLWRLAAAYTSGDRRAEVTLTGRNLVLPLSAETPPAETPPGEPVRLEDVRLTVRGRMGEAGLVHIEQASLAGPGVTAEVEGDVHLPSEAAPEPRADGRVTARVDLAVVARILRPFGILASENQVAGTADVAGEVQSGAAGLMGSVTVDLKGLEVRTAGRTIRESRARLPLTFSYANETKRWEAAAATMTSATASGSWRVAMTPTEPHDRLEVTCDLAFDGRRVRELLGEDVPADLRLSGPYRAQVRLAGALPPQGPWNRRLAALEGEGTLTVGQFAMGAITGGEGTLAWRLADGVLDLGPGEAPSSEADTGTGGRAAGPVGAAGASGAAGGASAATDGEREPPQPARGALNVAGGTVVPAGRILLAGEPPRFVITRPARVVRDVPLEGQEVRDTIKYASPVLAASVTGSGRFTMDVLSLDLPLAEGAGKGAKAVLRYRIDEFRTELLGPILKLVQRGGGAASTIIQTLGPVEVTLHDGVFDIAEHNLRYTETVSLRFGGRIGLDKRMNVLLGVPVTRALLERYKVSEQAVPYLEDVTIAVPLSGTIDDPQIDNEALAKRVGELVLEAIKRAALKHLGDWFKRP